MKTSVVATSLVAALAVLPAFGQQPETTVVEPVAPDVPTAPATPDLPPTPQPPAAPGAPAAPVNQGAAPATAQPAAEPMAKSEDGYIIKDAGLNDIFQLLARQAGKQYFHNVRLNGPEFRVTGHLNEGDPLHQIDELCFMYGLTPYTRGNTIYALTSAQLNQLPSAEFHYNLKYLRPNDIDQIKALIQPVLTPGTGIVNYEPKTNSIIIIDTAHHIEQAQRLLHNVDKLKGQVVVETKIMRINSNAAERYGVNWSSSLGATGVPIEVAKSLNSVFGISSTKSAIGSTSGESLGFGETSSNSVVLSPVQLNGVLRALNEGKLAKQISNPTLITEDNEQASISIIDRIPIITTQTTQASSGGNPTVTEEVRYKIDEEDPTIASDPQNHREIGISMLVTPTLLPDGTIRMRLRPRSAQVVEQITGVTGNVYPRVSESMIESIARVPDGHSLIVGGFYGEVKGNERTKVPILGDIPVVNFFFKSRDTTKEQTSLVFCVTPTSYNPSSKTATRGTSSRLRNKLSLRQDAEWANDSNPGPGHEANMCRTIRGMDPKPAPYYPLTEEQDPLKHEPCEANGHGFETSK